MRRVSARTGSASSAGSPVGAHDDERRDGRTLQVVDVQLGLRLVFEAAVTDVPDDPDDRRPRAGWRRADPHVLSDRILIPEELARHRFVDDGDWRRRAVRRWHRSRGRGESGCPSPGSNCASRGGTGLPAARRRAAAGSRAAAWSTQTCCRAACGWCPPTDTTPGSASIRAKKSR